MVGFRDIELNKKNVMMKQKPQVLFTDKKVTKKIQKILSINFSEIKTNRFIDALNFFYQN